MTRLALLIVCAGLAVGWSSDALAQSGSRPSGGGGSGSRPAGGAVANFQSIGSSVSSGFSRPAPTRSFGGGGSVSKPFAGQSSGSAVSPYINLFNTSANGATTFDNYNTLVRPQLQQQAVNQQVNQQLRIQQQRINQRVQAISAQNGIPPQGSDRILPTGHSTGVGFYSRFYPGLNRRR